MLETLLEDDDMDWKLDSVSWNDLKKMFIVAIPE